MIFCRESADYFKLVFLFFRSYFVRPHCHSHTGFRQCLEHGIVITVSGIQRVHAVIHIIRAEGIVRHLPHIPEYAFVIPIQNIRVLHLPYFSNPFSSYSGKTRETKYCIRGVHFNTGIPHINPNRPVSINRYIFSGNVLALCLKIINIHLYTSIVSSNMTDSVLLYYPCFFS